MSNDTLKAKTKLATLASSLDDLEAHLEPLFAQTLPETILGLEPIQQAKLQTVLPYLVYDLVFIYLKSRGIDPKTHPVVPELDRVRQYFEKITHAESPDTKRTTIDKAAAGRFIKHAITQAKILPTADDAPPKPSTSSARVPTKVTSKMMERERYERELKERDEEDSEEEGLEVFGDEAGDEAMGVDSKPSEMVDIKGKGKAITSTVAEPAQASTKRRRPAIDPFAGYGDDVLPLSEDFLSKKHKADEPSSSPPSSPEAINPKIRQSNKHEFIDPHTNGSTTPKAGEVLDAAKSGPNPNSKSSAASSEAKAAKKVKKKSKKSSTT